MTNSKPGHVRRLRRSYMNLDGSSSLDELRVAVRAKADFFITTNKSMINDRDDLEKVFNILIRTPKEMNEIMDESIKRQKQKIHE
jgi:hypothetical protein